MIWRLRGSQVCLYLQPCGSGEFRIFEGGCCKRSLRRRLSDLQVLVFNMGKRVPVPVMRSLEVQYFPMPWRRRPNLLTLPRFQSFS